MAANVKIEWFWITIHPDDTWKTTEQKLLDEGIELSKLSRCVYVIRSADSFAIRYPKKYSPTLYIGEGGFKQRVTSHRKWLASLYELAGDFQLEVAVCFPRVKNNLKAHKEFEAHLLELFYRRYGTLPLRNKQHETKHFSHTYEDNSTIYILGPGKGRKYKWALEPLKANPFHHGYTKTHE